MLVEFLSILDNAVAFLMFRTWNSIIVAISNSCFNMETNFGVGELSIVLFCWAFHLPQCIATVLRRKVNVIFLASISASWAFGHRDVRFRLESSHSHPIVVTFFSHRCFCFVLFRVSVSKSAKKKNGIWWKNWGVECIFNRKGGSTLLSIQSLRRFRTSFTALTASTPFASESLPCFTWSASKIFQDKTQDLSNYM